MGRSKRWVMCIGLALFVMAAGIAAWRFWPASEVPVAVPNRVCDRVLPGDVVSKLLPDKGKEFQESVSGEVDFNEVTNKPPTCRLSAGGRIIAVSYDHFAESKFTSTIESVKARIEENTNAPGSTAIRFGDSRGYSSSHGAELIIDCPKRFSSESTPRRGIIRVTVYEVPPVTTTVADRGNFGRFAAQVMRAVSKDVVQCKGGAAFPDSPSW